MQEIILYSALGAYLLIAVIFFIGLEVARIAEEFEFNYLEILAALGWPITYLTYLYDWIKSKWK